MKQKAKKKSLKKNNPGKCIAFFKRGARATFGWVRKNRIRIIASLVLGVISSVAYDYMNSGDCHFSIFLMVRSFFLFGLYYFLFFLASFFLQEDYTAGKKLNGAIMKKIFGGEATSLRQVLLIAGIIMVLWLPYFIAAYPGNMSNDTTGQIPMFYSMFDSEKEYVMQDQHPVFTTMVFGSIVFLGDKVFGDMHTGLAICIILQMLVTSCVFSFSIVWMRRKWGTTIRFSLFAVGFLTLFPIVPLMVISLSKDTFFCWIYVLLVLALFELVRSNFKLIKNRKFLVILTILCLGACLTKKLGIYIVSGTLILFIVFCGQKLKARAMMLVPLGVSLVTMFVIMPIIISNTSIKPSPTKEMFALPLQQTALTYIRHGDEMTEEELKFLDNLLDLSTLKERYKPSNGDPVRGPVKDDGDFVGYTKLYLKQLFKYPGSYVDAFANQTAGLFVPYAISPIFDNHWHTWNYGYFDESFFEKADFNKRQSEQQKKFYTWFTEAPVLNLSTFSVTYVVFIPTFLFVCLLEKKKKLRDLLSIVPIVASLAGLLLSSMVYYGNEAMRYIMPFVYTAPILLGYSQYLLRNSSEKRSRLRKRISPQR